MAVPGSASSWGTAGDADMLHPKPKSKWYEKLNSKLGQLFEGVASLDTKKGKGADGKVLMGAGGPCPLETRQSEWLLNLMQRQGALLGEAFEERIEAVQDSITDWAMRWSPSRRPRTKL